MDTGSIRKKYEEHGAEGYYKEHAEEYENPHLRQVRELIMRNKDKLDYSNALDLCCGNGEVSSILRDLGYEAIGCDPYTYKNYAKNFDGGCLRLGFDDILRGKLKGMFSCIICSFALHLCDEKDLYMVVKELFLHTKTLVIITPHKRPDLERLSGIKSLIDDYALTARGKKIRLRAYKAK